MDALANVATVGGRSGEGVRVTGNRLLARCAVGLGPILAADAADDPVIQNGSGGDAETNTFSRNGASLPGGTAASDCNAEATILAAYGQLPVSVLAAGSLGYGSCSSALPAGRAPCRVNAEATFTGDAGQRYTIFLRVAETGRIAFRGEVKPAAGQSVRQSIRFRTLGADPSAFTLELVADDGTVATPTGTATVLGQLAFTKGAGLRAAEPLAVYPNPVAGPATLSFAVAEAGEATLVLYDALGREVARPVEGAVEGAVVARLDVGALPAGVYVARLAVGARTETVRLTVVR